MKKILCHFGKLITSKPLSRHTYLYYPNLKLHWQITEQTKQLYFSKRRSHRKHWISHKLRICDGNIIKKNLLKMHHVMQNYNPEFSRAFWWRCKIMPNFCPNGWNTARYISNSRICYNNVRVQILKLLILIILTHTHTQTTTHSTHTNTDNTQHTSHTHTHTRY